LRSGHRPALSQPANTRRLTLSRATSLRASPFARDSHVNGGEVAHSFVTDHVSHRSHLVGGAIGAVFGFLMIGDKKLK